MTDGRRNLRFESLDDVMPEVERLLRGHTSVGHWSLGQVCHHLTLSMRRAVDLPADVPVDLSLRVPEERKRQVFETGVLPEGLPGPPEIMPAGEFDAKEEAEGLRAAIAYYRSSAGPVAPHRFFGPLTKDEWDRLQLIHFAHHLSFLRPE